ncbi:MAG: 50S ribosomal protein L4 [Bacteroidetes bacterium]|nr:50S ribosomal protein L4 [Bacteroidota bacterium]
MELSVLKYTGEDTKRKIKLNDSIFNIEPKDHSIYLDVKQIMANKRQGTHKSKEKGEITGSTRKLRKQKGTGAARVGSIKSPIFRGGGRIFGPQPRDYGFKLNKKLKILARKSALTYKAKDGKISVLEDFKFDKPKTKEYSSMLKKLSFENSKTLLILGANDKNIFLSSRNLQNSNVTTVDFLNTYDILNAYKVIFSESALKVLEKKLVS